MPWSLIPFGQFKGRTLPQVVFSDPDWFFWTIEGGDFTWRGSLGFEAQLIASKARRIRIPDNANGRLVAEYVIDPGTKRFSDLRIVPSEQLLHEGGSVVERKPLIDLSASRRLAEYDKRGGQILLSCVREILFGKPSARLTRKRTEEFFDDPQNFAP